MIGSVVSLFVAQAPSAGGKVLVGVAGGLAAYGIVFTVRFLWFLRGAHAALLAEPYEAMESAYEKRVSSDSMARRGGDADPAVRFVIELAKKNDEAARLAKEKRDELAKRLDEAQQSAMSSEFNRFEQGKQKSRDHRALPGYRYRFPRGVRQIGQAAWGGRRHNPRNGRRSNPAPARHFV